MSEWYDVVDCRGRSVLDLGGYSGGWGAKQALERGASQAIVVDNGEWLEYGWAAPEPEHEDIRFVDADLLDWWEPADIVIAANVIYHLKNPPAGVYHLKRLTREVVVIRTSTVEPEATGPDGWCWYPDGTGHENRTIWARPSEEGLLRTMEQAGFKQLQPVDNYGGFVVVGRV